MNTIKLLKKTTQSIKNTVNLVEKKKLNNYIVTILNKNNSSQLKFITDEDHLEYIDEYAEITQALLKYNLFSRKIYRNSRFNTKFICKLTGRPRGLVSKFYLSRMIVKQLATSAILPGIKRASW